MQEDEQEASSTRQRRVELRQHAILSRASISRENYEFETGRLVQLSKAA